MCAGYIDENKSIGRSLLGNIETATWRIKLQVRVLRDSGARVKFKRTKHVACTSAMKLCGLSKLRVPEVDTTWSVCKTNAANSNHSTGEKLFDRMSLH